MSGLVVVDVGNTRVKWGRCEGGRVAEVAALAADDAEVWQQQWDRWRPVGPWVVAGVQPRRRDALVAWLRGQDAEVCLLDSHRQLPLRLDVAEPERVGMDRLLNAVAANRRRRDGVPAVIVDAGSAVTVDLVDAAGIFRGGAIFPGLGLMSRALHDYTALLPLVAITAPGELPGGSTTAAIRAGVFHAVLGGIERLVAVYGSSQQRAPVVFVTGGDAPILGAARPDLGEFWPEMTLEGIRASADGNDE